MQTQRLTFTVAGDGDRCRLAVAGELDLSSREVFISAALGALQQTTSVLEIDVSGVTFCDSSGVSGLLAVHRIAANDRKRMVVTNPQGRLERTLTIAGLLTMLTGQEPR